MALGRKFGDAHSAQPVLPPSAATARALAAYSNAVRRLPEDLPRTQVTRSKKMVTMTRRIEFDAGHRVTQHGGKCKNLHGHRYVVDITIEGAVQQDGMILDFGAVKAWVGDWVDQHLDHGVLLHAVNDAALIEFARAQGWKVYEMDVEPTAENIAKVILWQASQLLPDHKVVGVRVYETPNCWADAHA